MFAGLLIAVALQLGRDQTAAETDRVTWNETFATMLQLGRDQTAAETAVLVDAATGADMLLQLGRDQTAAETLLLEIYVLV